MGAGALALTMSPFWGCGRSARPRRPDILFILTDDHRHDALGCAGHPWLHTPQLDRLAAGGVRFSNSFVTTSLCSPSRASFLTGRYAHAHGVCSNEQEDLPRSVPTFPTMLQNAGYRTAFIGKWHMARQAKPRPGFDHWEAFGRQGEYTRNTLNVNGRWELSNRYVTDDLTDRAERFLAAEQADPVLLVVSHKAVHAPFQPAPRHADLYRNAPIVPAATAGERLDLKPDWGGRRDDVDRTDHLKNYARTLAAVDESVGRLLDALERSGRLDDTVVVYAGDNGYMQGEHGGLWDKRCAYEESIRIPLLVRYPRAFAPGEVCGELALNLDLAPSLLRLAGVTPAPQMAGLDLAALARGEAGREAFLYEYFAELGSTPTTVALRTRDYKYVTYPENPELTGELYHLRYDPAESHNRMHEASYAGMRAELAARLEQEKTRTGFGMRNNRRP